MSRPNSKWLIVPALVVAVAAVACGAGGEEKVLLNKYFTASKVSDNMTLANIATVAFDPKSDGQMGSFKILSVTPEQVTPLTIKADAEALKKMVDDEKAFTTKKTEFQDANTEAIDRILKAEGKSPDEYKVAKQADTLMTFYNLGQAEVDCILQTMGYRLPKDYIRKNLEYYLQRLEHHRGRGKEEDFELTPQECAELFNEGTIFYFRYVRLFQLKDWSRTIRKADEDEA